VINPNLHIKERTRMTDVTDRLADLGQTPIGPPPVSAVEEDLARGRSALRKRHRTAGTAALSVAIAAAGGAVWFSSADPHGGHHTPGVAVPTVPLKVKLVDYVGQEPPGFHIGTIPQGYDLDLQASTPDEVVIAPVGDTDKDPDSFVGKVAITAEDASTYGGLSSLGNHSVTIGGIPGRVGDDGTATQVWWQVGSIMIDVQCWDSIGLTHDQLVNFASSVSTTSKLQLSKG
jgi:hypothetical protein